MPRWIGVLIIILPALPSCGGRTQADPVTRDAAEATPSAPAWRPLFDGVTLTNWVLTGAEESWGVEEGGILAIKKPGEGHVRSVEVFEDFEFRGEFRLDAGADAGIFFRWADAADPGRTALEIQLTEVGPPGLTPLTGGALLGIAAPAEMAFRPAGEWNAFELRAEGERIRMKINGKGVLDLDLPTAPASGTPRPRRGYVGFENQRYFAWFRDLRIRVLAGAGARNR